MKSTLSYFYIDFVFTAIAIIAAFFIGGGSAAFTVLFLTVLEVALSFDNAVVNAGILKHWDEVWRRRFLVWGIFVAVFLMRLIFPLIIVAVVGTISPIEALKLAIYSPKEYSAIMTSAHHQVAAFGGTFLIMVFCSFFMSATKEEHWLTFIEKPLSFVGKIHGFDAALALFALLMTSFLLPEAERLSFLIAGAWGIIVFILSKGFAVLINPDGGAAHIVQQGIGGFLYLELIDASFSFDGVLGAFALTNNLFVIALGLGAGAMYVRSFTILLVHKGTLNQYRYLEHGAFWAIGALALLMLIGVKIEIPEIVTGLIGGAFIAIALICSILKNKKAS